MTVKGQLRSLTIIRLLACAGAASMIAACASLPRLSDLTPRAVDPQSAAAADVIAATKTPGDYPKFSEVPPAPNDVRPVSGWRAAVLDEKALKASTEAQVAAVPFTLSDTEGFAAAERAKIPADEAVAPTSTANEDTESFAAAARARATPPSSPK
jgi:hypothetical protein